MSWLFLLAAAIFIVDQAGQALAEEVPDSERQQQLAALGEYANFEVVFDSNRSGTTGIYAIQVNGKNLRKIIDTEWYEMYPDPSPDGKLIAFARTAKFTRGHASEVWLINTDGSSPRKLADNGTFPSFSSDGKTVYFERDRRRAMAIGVDGTREREIFPKGFKGFAKSKYKVVKPRLSSDGRYLGFTSDRRGQWHGWYADMQSKTTQVIGKGCEATPWGTQGDFAMVRKTGANAGSGLFAYKQQTGDLVALVDMGPPRGHEYYPSFASNDRLLLYSDCPADQHADDVSNYQVWIRDLKKNVSLRVTFDEFTNRWPKLINKK